MTPSQDVPVVHHRQASAAWLAASREVPIDPGRVIIDAHHHFSEHWGGYLPADLQADAAGRHVVATVYVQCGWRYRSSGDDALRPVGETQAVLDAVRAASLQPDAPRLAAAIVGYADLRLGAAVDEVLAAHVAAGRGRFRGIRNSGAFHPTFRHGVLPRPMQGLYGDAAFRAGYARLARHGLSFDAWIYHPQLPELLALARAFPDTPLVLDHIGGLLVAVRLPRLR